MHFYMINKDHKKNHESQVDRQIQFDFFFVIGEEEKNESCKILSLSFYLFVNVGLRGNKKQLSFKYSSSFIGLFFFSPLLNQFVLLSIYSLI